VLAWNPTLGVVSRKDPVAACERLVFESFELDRALALAARLRIADVGSGGGFPGVVWALEHPDAQVVLIERRARKSAFLEHVCRTLAIENASVFAGEVRESTASESLRGMFDVVVTMAVGDPSATARHVEWLLGSGAKFATTVPRGVEAPARVGGRLEKIDDVGGEFGRYVIYRAGV
jgi:16S rRNA (guanine(527)-N(7))-methyltransferase RsmG